MKVKANRQRTARFFKKNDGKATLNAITETKYFENLNEYNEVLLAAIVFLTAILNVGGVFGVMNTMFAAIGQRTQHVGVMWLTALEALR